MHPMYIGFVNLVLKYLRGMRDIQHMAMNMNDMPAISKYSCGLVQVELPISCWVTSLTYTTRVSREHKTFHNQCLPEQK